MSDSSVLEINKKIELEVKNGAYKGKYPSKVAEIEDDYIKVLAPLVREQIVPLRKNMDLDIYYTGDNAAFKFSSTIIDRNTKPIPILTIETPDKISRIQRREHFRLDVTKDVKYCHLDSEGKKVGDYIETVTSDLSGGGTRIVVGSENIEVGTFIELYIDIPGLEEIPITGKVVQLYDMPGENILAAGIKFVEIPSGIRDRIISWLFKYQRELRRKGLL